MSPVKWLLNFAITPHSTQKQRIRMKVFMMKPSTCEPVTNISSYEIENAQIESAEKASLLQKE